jgi:hypothetical protein
VTPSPLHLGKARDASRAHPASGPRTVTRTRSSRRVVGTPPATLRARGSVAEGSAALAASPSSPSRRRSAVRRIPFRRRARSRATVGGIGARPVATRPSGQSARSAVAVDAPASTLRGRWIARAPSRRRTRGNAIGPKSVRSRADCRGLTGPTKRRACALALRRRISDGSTTNGR